MAPPYLVHVTSSPTTVPATVWAQVHADQHLPDLVSSQTCERAGFYREISGPTFSSRRPAQGNPPSFLALYHTVFAEPLTTENYNRGVRPASDLFRQAGSADDTIKGNAHLDARNYILVGECGRCETTGEKDAAPYVLTVEMEPTAAEAEVQADRFERRFLDEHLPALSELPGHDMSVLYRIGKRAPLTKTQPGKYLAIHHVSSLDAFDSRIFFEPSSHQEEHGQRCIVRGWELMHAEGYHTGMSGETDK